MNPSAGHGLMPLSPPMALPSAAEPRETPGASCGPKTAKHELANLAAKLPAPKISTGEAKARKWEAAHAADSGFGDCAALSWSENAGSAKHRGDFPPGCAP